MNQNLMPWLLLVLSLPTRNSTARMRIWRTLKSLGCAGMRDGAYLLPRAPEREAALARIAQEIVDAGGSACVLQVAAVNRRQSEEFKGLFDRSADYGALLEDLVALRKSLARGRNPAAGRRLAALRRAYEAVVRCDFFPGAARQQVGRALEQAEAAAAPDEPHRVRRAIQRLDQREFRGRTWATRQGLWVDRMASAWLIKRFIDPEARFLWLRNPRDCPRHALGFDFDRARFTHVGDRVTFETLLASFGHDEDPALARLGAIVHYLDVGGVPAPEAAGMEMVLAGARRRCRNDDELLEAATATLDCLYAAYQEGESHG
ncbi:MAG: chromate resistance protein [Betaproteobacteria bacterium]|nr:chromate resistance protein [Betaproteobacteria bacterium]